MQSAEDRKKAKQDYLAALEMQKKNKDVSIPNLNEQDNSKITAEQKISERDKIFEEKRKKFIEKQNKEQPITIPIPEESNSGNKIFKQNVITNINNNPENFIGKHPYEKSDVLSSNKSSQPIIYDREDEIRRKREQQQEYNMAFNQQMNEQQQQNSRMPGNGKPSSNRGVNEGYGGGLPLGSDREDEIRRKREQQQEYNRGLDEQLKIKQHLLQITQPDSFATSNINPSGLNKKFSSKQNNSDDFKSFIERNHKNANKDTYEPDYSMARNYPGMGDNSNGSLGNIGSDTSALMDKKQNQNEYSALLNNQVAFNKQNNEKVLLQKKNEELALVSSPNTVLQGEWYTCSFTFLNFLLCSPFNITNLYLSTNSNLFNL